MVLHDITNDAKLVKVTTTAFSAKWLLEGDLHVVNMVSVPGCAKEFVSESQDENVLYHLLAQVMIDTEDLILMPVWCQSTLELSGAGKIFAEGLLNLHVDMISLDMFRNLAERLQ
jgi:hypothetical protein